MKTYNEGSKFKLRVHGWPIREMKEEHKDGNKTFRRKEKYINDKEKEWKEERSWAAFVA